MTSASSVLNLCFREDAIAEVPRELAGGAQVDGSAKKLRELELYRGEPNEAHPRLRLELDEKVDVAVGLLIAVEHGAKQREAADPMPLAELSDDPAIEYARSHRAHRNEDSTAEPLQRSAQDAERSPPEGGVRADAGPRWAANGPETTPFTAVVSSTIPRR